MANLTPLRSGPRYIVPHGPGTPSEVRGAFDRWLMRRDGAPLTESQVRFDLIRPTDGALLRVLVDADALGPEPMMES